MRITRSDFRKLKIAQSSVDLLFTDPPYTQEALPLWGDLGKFAEKVLKPGCLLVTYCPAYCLPVALNSLGEHLTYVWTGVVVYRHQRQARLFDGRRQELVLSSGVLDKQLI